MSVKIQFDSNQDYQLKAVDSIVNLFEGLSREELGNEEREFALNSKEDTDAIPNVDELFELNKYLYKFSTFIKKKFIFMFHFCKLVI